MGKPSKPMQPILNHLKVKVQEIRDLWYFWDSLPDEGLQLTGPHRTYHYGPHGEVEVKFYSQGARITYVPTGVSKTTRDKDRAHAVARVLAWRARELGRLLR
jgi:hypothetical protein